MATRISQLVVETLVTGQIAKARVSQVVATALVTGQTTQARISQLVVEALETVVTVTEIDINVSEQFSFTDGFSHTDLTVIVLSTGELFSFTDGVIQAQVVSIVTSDSLSLGDILVLHKYPEDMVDTDTLDLADDPGLLMELNLSFGEAFSFTDDDLLIIPIDLDVEELFDFTDDGGFTLIGILSQLASESFDFTDDAILINNILTNFSDTLSLSDAVLYQILNFLIIVTGDNLFLSDGQQFQKISNSELGDTFSIGDTPVLVVSLALNVSESLDTLNDTVDNIEPPTPLDITESDSLDLGDDVTISLNSSFVSLLRRYLNDVPSPRS